MVSSTQASSVLAASYPPSASAFDATSMDVLRPMLRFLADAGVAFTVNITNVQLGYALFAAGTPPVRDRALVYTNLFDAMVDALVDALEREGIRGVLVAVTEIGWPTAGHQVATLQNATAYNAKMVERVARGVGTPRWPSVPVEVFLFDLYNEDSKPGVEFERHFSIFMADGSKAYDINFA